MLANKETNSRGERKKNNQQENEMGAQAHLYMVSASTSPNQTRRFGVKFCPVSSNMATSPPPFSCRQRTAETKRR